MIPEANILQPLIDIANSVLKFFHDNAGLSWGMSIIALTVEPRWLFYSPSLGFLPYDGTGLQERCQLGGGFVPGDDRLSRCPTRIR